MAAPANRVNIDVEKALKKLREIPGLYNTRNRKFVLRKAAKVIQAAAKSNISDSDKPHHRYRTSKASSSIRAPKGQGNIVATYLPGNLRRSIQIMSFRKSKSRIFIGPKVDKKGAGGEFGSEGKVDGYYAHMVEFGTINMSSHKSKGFMRRAASSQSKTAQSILVTEIEKKIKRWVAKNKK